MKDISTDNLFRSFSLVASAALLLFGGYHLLADHSEFLAYVEMASAILIFFNLLITNKSREKIHRHILTGLVYVVLMTLFVTGGIAGTGVFWFFMFPVAAFFLLGSRGGFVWVAALIVGSLFLLLNGMGFYTPVGVQQASAVLIVLTVLVYLYEKTRNNYERELASERERLRTLYEITTHKGETLADQFHAALKLGAETLQTKIAVLSHIEKGKFTVEYSVTPPDSIKEGDVFDLEETYCDITVKKDDVLSIDEMKTDEHKVHACYQKFALESYIGVPVKVFGQLHGTLAFMAPDPHRPSFTDGDRDFVRLMGKWMSTMLEREQIEKMKSEFVSVASHQLRTPLTGIKWFAELMIRGKAGDVSPEQKDFLEQIHSSNERMIKLVEDLLNVSRIETGTKFEIKKVSSDIIPILDSLATDLVGLAHKHEVTIQKTNNVPTTLPLLIDADKIRQVFANLLSNAVKYSKTGGVVTMDFADKPQEHTMTLMIKDAGLGIPEKQQSRMFEKFFRADNVQTAETDGTGLGLYIAKAIIEGHEGKIWFESKENQGTTFFVQLPKN